MSTRKPKKKTPEAESAERLEGLLRDLETLQAYLQERGHHAYELAQRFLANARRDAGSRAYDERQATMLEYQHYIWHEIAWRHAIPPRHHQPSAIASYSARCSPYGSERPSSACLRASSATSRWTSLRPLGWCLPS
jgi:hypothetical protein